MSWVTSATVKAASAARAACDRQSSSTTPTQRSNSAIVSSNCRHSSIMSSSSTLRPLSCVLARSRHAEIWRTVQRQRPHSYLTSGSHYPISPVVKWPMNTASVNRAPGWWAILAENTARQWFFNTARQHGWSVHGRRYKLRVKAARFHG